MVNPPGQGQAAVAKPGFCVCNSCDPPRLVPVAGLLAHLTEHHLSVSDIASAEVTES